MVINVDCRVSHRGQCMSKSDSVCFTFSESLRVTIHIGSYLLMIKAINGWENRIEAIKFIRNFSLQNDTYLGLKECKDIMEYFYERRNYDFV
jgi:hypothetical protein